MVGDLLILTFVHSRRRQKEQQISVATSSSQLLRMSTIGVQFHC